MTEARTVLNELLKSATETYVPPFNIAVAYLAVGEREKALECLETGVTEKDVRMVFLKVEPQWEQLRTNQRFVELIKRMGIE